uniref:PAP_central domain-containing protein n=1 Tax=Meloidogyne hapla TaxID=6305 RepID=A0A1I8B9R1_MELHA
MTEELLNNLKENSLVESWNLLNLNSKDFYQGDQMPIISSLLPHQNTAFNVNEFTRQKIIEKMREAFLLFEKNSLKSTIPNNYLSKQLFKPFDYKNHYKYFLIIICAVKNEKNKQNNLNEICEFMKTKIRLALVNWVNKSEIYENGIKINLSEFLESYHSISDYQENKTCYFETKIETKFWLVGVLLKQKENISNLLEENIFVRFTNDIEFYMSLSLNNENSWIKIIPTNREYLDKR